MNKNISPKISRLSEISNLVNVPPFYSFNVTDSAYLTSKSFMHELMQAEKFCQKHTPFIIRPSFCFEDSAIHSYAGLLESKVFSISNVNLYDAIHELYMHSIEILRNNISSDISVISFLIQQFITTGPSGVAFSCNPVNGKNEIIIESVNGLNCWVTGGFVTPDNIIASFDKQILSSSIGSKRTLLYWDGDKIATSPNPQSFYLSINNSQISYLLDAILCLQRKYATPIDIEWAFCGNKLYILQCRPVTGLVK